MADYSAVVETLGMVAAGKNPRLRFSGTKVTGCYKALAAGGFISKEKGTWKITEDGTEFLELVGRANCKTKGKV